MTWLLVAAGGAAGAALRYLVDVTVSARTGERWPWGTLTVNVAGSALLGYLVGADPGDDTMWLLGAGLCGAFTTASAFSWEALALMRSRGVRHAGAYVTLTLALTLAALVLGRLVGSL